MALVTYITMDSVRSGVGASQVWPYVERLARDHSMHLVSFEPEDPRPPEAPSDFDWTTIPFRRSRLGALRRVGIAATRTRRASDRIVHARADLPALAALLARHDRWIWDMRSFWREQRIYLGDIRPGSPSDRLMAAVEKAAANRSSAIICLAHAAVPVLTHRFGADVAQKTHVIPTAVDTERFRPAGPVPTAPLRVTLIGSYNRFYDGVAMAAFIAALRLRTGVHAEWVGPNDSSYWRETLGSQLDWVAPAVPFAEVPTVVSASSLGLAMCEADGGPALKAAVPTKIAEFLACGRPVVVNRGLGDMDDLIERYRCGVVVGDASRPGIETAVDQLLALLDDPELAERARACAVEVFSVDRAVASLSKLYESVAG